MNALSAGAGIGLTMLSAASAGVADAAARSADEPIPIIRVHAVLPEDRRLTPGAAAVLDQDDMDRLRAYTLHDLLDSLPGLRTIDDDVLGRRSAIGVRGAPPRRSRKTLLLEDGTPINFSTYLDASAHYTPPIERLHSVDVLKGAGHVLYGPLNNHGIVNFRNLRPTAAPETRIELAAGSQDTFKRHLRHSRTDGAVGTVLAYTGADADGSFDVESFGFDDFYGRLEWAIDEQRDAAFSLTWHRERSRYDESNLTPQEYALAPRTKRGRFGQEYNTFALDYVKADAAYHLEIDPGRVVSARLFATYADRPRFTVDPGEVLVDALPDVVLEDPELLFVPGEQGFMVGRHRRYRTLGGDVRVEQSGFEWGDLDHSLQWGVRAERHLLDDMRTGGAPGEKLDVSNQGIRTRDVTYQASAVSAYLQDVVQFGDWTVTPGIRAEHYSQSRQRRVLATDPGPHPPKDTDDNTLLLPSLSVLYTGLESSELFANLARGYTPAPARTAEAFPLRPETGINAQLGVRTRPRDGVSIETAAFFNRISNTVVQLPFSIEGANVVLNSADSRSYGIDLALEMNSDPHGAEAVNLFSQLVLNYTRAEFTEDFANAGIDGNRVPEIPAFAGSLTIGIRHRAGWHVSATLSHFGAFYTDPLNTRELMLADEDREPVGPGGTLDIREPSVLGRVDSHSLLSARATYSVPGRDIQVWLQGRNLTNRHYVTDLENGLRPGARRTVVAGVRLGF